MIRTQAEFDHVMRRMSDKPSIAAMPVTAHDVSAMDNKLQRDTETSKLMNLLNRQVEMQPLMNQVLEQAVKHSKMWDRAVREL